MQFIKSLMSLTMIAAVVYLGITVPLGEKTLFGHVRAIWGSEEAQELVDGVRETGAPMLDKLDRAVSAGLEEARRQGADEAGDAPANQPANPTDSATGEGGAVRDSDGRRETPAADTHAPTGAEGGEPAGESATGHHPKPAGTAVARTDGPGAAARGDGHGDDGRSAGFEIRPKIDIHVAP